MTAGFVSLVGAGPGDPGLLTRRAAARLEAADLVLYDALVSHEILELASRAQRFGVGKRAGRRAIQQETIHRLMIRAAWQGKRVVRLKGGDPFVLGRGGEEVLALAAAGVPFEIVPGVTAATAAPALAGIPVTHRKLASAFVVVSGHAEAAYRPVLEALPPGAVTIVVLMGLATRRALGTLLLARGWKPTTPVAVMLWASTGRSRTWVGTLDELGRTPIVDSPDPTGTITIGEVVSLRARVARAREVSPGAAAETEMGPRTREQVACHG